MLRPLYNLLIDWLINWLIIIMCLIINDNHYVFSAYEMTYIVSGGGVKLYSLTHSLIIMCLTGLGSSA